MGKATVDTVIATTDSENEKVFLSRIIDYITGLWDGIVCTITCGSTVISPATADDMIWSNDDRTNVDFELKPGIILRFQSYAHGSSSSDVGIERGYNLFFIIDETPITLAYATTTHERGCFYFCGVDGYVFSGLKYSANGVRRYIFSKYVDDNMFIIWLGDKNVTSWKNSQFFVAGVKDTSDAWHYSAGTNIESADFYNSSGVSPASKSQMFSYEAKMGCLDFISHSSFVSGSTKSFTSTDIYDSTTVTMGDTYSVDNGVNFLAIGAHSLVRLDE